MTAEEVVRWRVSGEGVCLCDHCAEEQNAEISKAAEELMTKLSASDQTPESFNTRPDYYPSVAGVDSIRVMEMFNFNIGNAIKYLWRCGKKPGAPAVQDLKKAIQYIDFEINRLRREE